MSLFGDNLSIGNVVVNQFQATLINVTPSNIPKLTRVEIWCRLRKTGKDSGWFPKGVFYTKKPEYDPESGVMKISGYDMMYLLDQTPYPTGVIVSWSSETMRTVASTLATAVGIPLEDATQVEAYDFPAPPYGYTAREILSQIAIANGGNWMLTYVDTSSGGALAVTPKLRLRHLDDVVSTQALGRTVQRFEKGDTIPEITHVVLNYGINASGATMYKESVASPDDGRTIEYDIPVITDGDVVQDIADDLLSSLGSISVDAFSASGALVNPLMEIGDAVTCNSCTGIFGSIDTEFGKGMVCGITSPGIPEEDDFPYMTGTERAADREKRTNATNSARITVNADAIAAEVTRATDAESGLESYTQSLVEQSADALTITLKQYTDDSVDEHAQEQEQYIRYSADGLELGESSSSAKAILSPTGLELISPDDNVGASIAQDPLDGNYKLFVFGGRFENYVEGGDHWYIIFSGADNNYRLTIKARG